MHSPAFCHRSSTPSASVREENLSVATETLQVCTELFFSQRVKCETEESGRLAKTLQSILKHCNTKDRHQGEPARSQEHTKLSGVKKKRLFGSSSGKWDERSWKTFSRSEFGI
ncbi:hypothetical protein FQA47_023383 [Oryzias melastigma]|uniref:Uncharacterized protein n=1 Tax=Oryzias melastigma TaxID=30732 RepID=A0A834CIN9_ORYME|nr:hypothetical protein FQA47_023383 [Oryzias melastigma]